MRYETTSCGDKSGNEFTWRSLYLGGYKDGLSINLVTKTNLNHRYLVKVFIFHIFGGNKKPCFQIMNKLSLFLIYRSPSLITLGQFWKWKENIVLWSCDKLKSLASLRGFLCALTRCVGGSNGTWILKTSTGRMSDCLRTPFAYPLFNYCYATIESVFSSSFSISQTHHLDN